MSAVPAIGVMTHEGDQGLLTAADRCDQCGARAYVRFFTASGVLELCTHHFNRHEQTIINAGYVIHDERHRLYNEAKETK